MISFSTYRPGITRIIIIMLRKYVKKQKPDPVPIVWESLNKFVGGLKTKKKPFVKDAHPRSFNECLNLKKEQK